MTQAALGGAVGLDRSAVSRLEKAERKLNVAELAQIAAALQRPLAYFVAEPVPAVVSRRATPSASHQSGKILEVELESLASDVRSLAQQRLYRGEERAVSARTPRTHEEAEAYAGKLRRELGLGNGPVPDLMATCEQLGLITFAAHLGEGEADGGCVEVQASDSVLGVAVINGEADAGRRRMTLAHELGQWLFGDAYDSQGSLNSEQMINSFAIHFLAPRAGLLETWNAEPGRPARERALRAAAHYKLSWSAAVSQLRNLDLITHQERESLVADKPRAGDYMRLGLCWTEELRAPALSPGLSAAILNAYLDRALTPARALELLRGTLPSAGLPALARRSLDDLRPDFAGHGW